MRFARRSLPRLLLPQESATAGSCRSIKPLVEGRKILLVGRFSKPQIGRTNHSKHVLLFLPIGAKTCFGGSSVRKLDLRGEEFNGRKQGRVANRSIDEHANGFSLGAGAGRTWRTIRAAHKRAGLPPSLRAVTPDGFLAPPGPSRKPSPPGHVRVRVTRDRSLRAYLGSRCSEKAVPL